MKIKPVWQLSLNTAWHAGKQTCKRFFQDFHILVKKSWIKWTMHTLQNAEWSIGFGDVSLIIRNCCGWESYMKRVCLPENGKRLPGRLLRTPYIKSYQPFWCWNFLIAHEFGQIFSSLALKVWCSLKSWGYKTEKSSLWHKYPEFGFFKKQNWK